MRRLVLSLSAFAWLLHCSSDPTDAAPLSPDYAGVVEDAAVDAPAAPSSPVGRACKGSQPGEAGTCTGGTLCYPAPVGYCTLPCGFAACPTSSVCVPSPTTGPLCATPCTTDDDCRKSDGYTCSPDDEACA